MRAKFGMLQQTHRTRLPAKFRLDRFILSSCGGENSQFLPFFDVFWTSAFSDVANCHQSQTVEHASTTTNLPLSNGIKIVSVLQRLHGEIGRTNSDVQKRDGQTNRQTRNHKHRRAAAKPAACAKPLMLSTVGTKRKRKGGR